MLISIYRSTSSDRTQINNKAAAKEEMQKRGQTEERWPGTFLQLRRDGAGTEARDQCKRCKLQFIFLLRRAFRRLLLSLSGAFVRPADAVNNKCNVGQMAIY